MWIFQVYLLEKIVSTSMYSFSVSYVSFYKCICNKNIFMSYQEYLKVMECCDVQLVCVKSVMVSDTGATKKCFISSKLG